MGDAFRHPRPRRLTALLVVLVPLTILVVWPLAELIGTAASRGWTQLGATVSGNGTVVWHTLWTSAVASVVSVAVATAVATAGRGGTLPGWSLLRLGVLAPLLVPPFVSGLAWEQAYGPGGLTDHLLGISFPLLYGPVGVVAALVVHAVPLAYLVVAVGLATRADPEREWAARAAGADARTTFRTVTLPALRPSLTAAAGITFVTSANAFGIPAVLGLPAGFGTMTTRIYQDLARSADPRAFTRVLALASLLVLAVGLIVLVSDAGTGLGAVTDAGQALGLRRREASATPVAMIGVYVLATSVLPLVALLLTALTRAVGLPPVPSNWTAANFASALTGHPLTQLRTSLLLAALAATVVLGLGGMAALAGRRRGGRLVGASAVLTFAVPGSALAVAVLLAYGSWLRDTLLLILLAYLAKFWALGHRPLAGTLDTVGVDATRAARASGAGPWTTGRTILVPLLRPALAAAWLIVFLFALHELTMSSLLYGPGTETLAVGILNLRQLGDVSVTAAMAILLVGLVLVGATPLLVARRRLGRLR